MKAAVIEQPGVVRLTELERPVITADEVLLRVGACGVCGTDVHIFHGGFRADYPVIPGHEFTGEVVEAGGGVTHVQVGDRVVVDPNINCGVCPYCRRGLIHLCENLIALGVNIPGGFQEFCRVPAKQVYRLPAQLTWEEGAFVEPLACCLHGIDRAEIRPADSVVILGAGAIGLLMLQLAREAGARQVIVSEPVAEKIALAQQLGANMVINPTGLDLEASVRELTGIGADVVIECVGRPQTVSQAFQLVRRGGRVVLFGVNPKEAEVAVRPYSLFINELTVLGSYINPFTHARAIDLLASGAVKVQSLISHRFPLGEFAQALETAGSGAAIKVIVTP